MTAASPAKVLSRRPGPVARDGPSGVWPSRSPWPATWCQGRLDARVAARDVVRDGLGIGDLASDGKIPARVAAMKAGDSLALRVWPDRRGVDAKRPRP